MADLTGKTVLITGAAHGMGAAGFRLFASIGATVVGVDVNDKLGEAIAEELGEPHRYRHLDVSSSDEWSKLLKEIEDDLGGVDVVWLNAAILGAGGIPYGEDPSETVNEKNYRRVIEVNTIGNMIAVEQLTPLMEARGGGDIIIAASGAGLIPYTPDPVYTTSKHAVVGFGRSMAPWLIKRGIRLNVLAPGSTNTGMSTDADVHSDDHAATDNLQAPVRVAEAVLKLLDANVHGEVQRASADKAFKVEFGPLGDLPPIV